MKKHLTEIVFILDRSGSMTGLEDDTIGGFNAMLKKMKKQSGDAIVSTVLFDTESTVVHDRLAIEKVPDLTEDDYYVGGCTALLDAIGGAICHIDNIYKKLRASDVPENTLFVITTDGMENASRVYAYKQIKRMIEQYQEKDHWEFLFLGANIDAIQTAARIGIGSNRSVNYLCDDEGIALNYEVVSEAVGTIRCNKPLSEKWKARIDADYQARGRKKSKHER